jgi:hypothetical protein
MRPITINSHQLNNNAAFLLYTAAFSEIACEAHVTIDDDAIFLLYSPTFEAWEAREVMCDAYMPNTSLSSILVYQELLFK